MVSTVGFVPDLQGRCGSGGTQQLQQHESSVHDQEASSAAQGRPRTSEAAGAHAQEEDGEPEAGEARFEGVEEFGGRKDVPQAPHEDAPVAAAHFRVEPVQLEEERGEADRAVPGGSACDEATA